MLTQSCSGPRGDPNTVIFYQNERLVVPSRCTKKPCTLEDLQQNFNEVFSESQCNLKFCKIEKSKGNLIFISFSAIMISFFLHMM